MEATCIILTIIMKIIMKIMVLGLLFCISFIFFTASVETVFSWAYKNNKKQRIKELKKHFNLTDDEIYFIINNHNLYKKYQQKLINNLITNKK